jgi:hypothetical protein
MAIVRTLGKPEIKQIVYLEKFDDKNETFGLYTTQEAESLGLMKCEGMF